MYTCALFQLYISSFVKLLTLSYIFIYHLECKLNIWLQTKILFETAISSQNLEDLILINWYKSKIWFELNESIQDFDVLNQMGQTQKTPFHHGCPSKTPFFNPFSLIRTTHYITKKTFHYHITSHNQPQPLFSQSKTSRYFELKLNYVKSIELGTLISFCKL